MPGSSYLKFVYCYLLLRIHARLNGWTQWGPISVPLRVHHRSLKAEELNFVRGQKNYDWIFAALRNIGYFERNVSNYPLRHRLAPNYSGVVRLMSVVLILIAHEVGLCLVGFHLMAIKADFRRVVLLLIAYEACFRRVVLPLMVLEARLRLQERQGIGVS